MFRAKLTGVHDDVNASAASTALVQAVVQSAGLCTLRSHLRPWCPGSWSQSQAKESSLQRRVLIRIRLAQFRLLVLCDEVRQVQVHRGDDVTGLQGCVLNRPLLDGSLRRAAHT
jgi:hypothetical protein